MRHSEREQKALRSITVSTAAALKSVRDQPGAADAVRDRADRLLADLESQVIRDGADPEILAAIDAERRHLRE